MHVDMDAFYASIELRRRPELRGKPVIVGGSSRGVVLSATYEARAAGVRSGMSSTHARRLCPQATFIQPNFDSYAEVSASIVAVFESVTAVVESASIDEAFLDVTGSIRRLGSAVSIGEYIRAVVADEQHITCSVGIGPTKFIAKLASRAAKPDGLCEVTPDQVISFLHPLPIEAMWGVGESTAEKLHRLGLFTVADLAHTPKNTLQRAFGPHAGVMLNDLAWGRDARRVIVRDPERSVGSQETFPRDTDDPEVVKRELLRMSDRTASRLRKARMLGRTIAISIRFADFTELTRSATVSSPTDVTDEIYAQAVALYEKLGLQRARVRRVGVRAEGLVDAHLAYRQPQLSDPERGWREAEQAIDAAVMKFGPAAVQRAALTRRRHQSSSHAQDQITGRD
ncbi:MAG: DNA polymerase IV [Propionibacteriaceae bacterium]|nr:DNA polymerase IV [Propionibacteriaceae bacterium]